MLNWGHSYCLYLPICVGGIRSIYANSPWFQASIYCSKSYICTTSQVLIFRGIKFICMSILIKIGPIPKEDKEYFSSFVCRNVLAVLFFDHEVVLKFKVNRSLPFTVIVGYNQSCRWTGRHNSNVFKKPDTDWNVPNLMMQYFILPNCVFWQKWPVCVGGNKRNNATESIFYSKQRELN